MATHRHGALLASLVVVLALAGVVAPAAGAQDVQVSAPAADLSTADPVAPTVGSGAPILGSPAAPSSDADASTDNGTLFLQLPEPVATTDAAGNVSTQELKSAGEPLRSAVVDRVGRIDGVTVERTFWITNAVLVTVDHERVDVDADLRSIPEVRAVHPDVTFQHPTASVGSAAAVGDAVQAGPSTSVGATAPTALRTQSTTYGLDLIDAPDAWNQYGTSGGGATVAVLDTGVDESHPDIDLTAGGWEEFDLTGDSVASSPSDPDGHGTHVSGTVVGGDASGRSIGVAPDAALMHGKVFQDNVASMSSVLAGIQWAVDADADVVTMSLGSLTDGESTYESRYIDAVRQARTQGTVVVSSSGNDGTGVTTSPGNVYSVVSVGAVDANGDVASFSSGEVVDTSEAWGSSAPSAWPDQYVVPGVTAPGDAVVSAYRDSKMASISGTSQAAPHVAGTVALLRSVDGSASPSDIEAALRDSAVHPDGGEDVEYGTGIVDADAAVAALGRAPDLRVTDVTTDEPVEGDELVVDATVSNAGDADANQEVELLVDGALADSASVSVSPGSSTTVALAADTEAGDAPGVDVEVRTEDDAQTTTVGVVAGQAEFTIDGLSSPDVVAGEELVVDATVGNGGTVAGTTTVTAAFGERTGERTVSLSPGDQRTVTFSFPTSADDAGNSSVDLVAGEASASQTVTVAAPAEFAVTDADVPDSVTVGTAVDVAGTVTNVGGVAGETTVTLTVGTTVDRTKTVQLEQGATSAVVFEDVDASTLTVGRHEATIGTDDDTVTRTLVVEREDAGDDLVVAYAGEDGEVDTGELLSAIGDWRGEAIDTTDLLAVLDAWRADS